MSSVLTEAKKTLFKENDIPKAIKMLEEIAYKPKTHSTDVVKASLELLGLAEMKRKDAVKAKQWFLKAENYYLTGYSSLIIEDFDETKKYWEKVLQENPYHWSGHLYGMLCGQLQSGPSFFQLRNYMEATVSDFFFWGKSQYLHNLFSYADFLVQINMETYKYIGRAIANSSELLDLAESFYLKSQKLMPQDPEIYFHLGQLKFKQQQFEDAQILLRQALSINPTYTPVQWLLDDIKNLKASSLHSA